MCASDHGLPAHKVSREGHHSRMETMRLPLFSHVRRPTLPLGRGTLPPNHSVRGMCGSSSLARTQQHPPPLLACLHVCHCGGGSARSGMDIPQRVVARFCCGTAVTEIHMYATTVQPDMPRTWLYRRVFSRRWGNAELDYCVLRNSIPRSVFASEGIPTRPSMEQHFAEVSSLDEWPVQLLSVL